MGSSEHPEQVVYTEACARLGMDLLKRSTGGRSVLQTTDVLNLRQLAKSSERSRESGRPWAGSEDNDLLGLLRPAGQFVHRSSMCAFNEGFGFHAAGVHARSANADLSAF